MIEGGGGGGKSGGGSGSVRASSRKADPYKQSLRNNTVAEVIDVLCEGPILGLVAEIDEGEAYRGKSIAFDNTPLMSPTGSKNFSGYNVKLRKGTADQNPIQANNYLQTTITYDPAPELTEKGVSREVDLPDADELRIVLYVPSFYGQKKADGSFYDASVYFKIYCNDILVFDEDGTVAFGGQTTGAYQRWYVIGDLVDTYGPAPWTVKIVLNEGYYHEDQTYLHDRVYWTQTIGVTYEQLCWPYVAHSRVRVLARQFGGNVPTRAYEIYGYAQCPMPNVYDPDSTAEDRFSGTWDGETWQYEWTDNPAWCWLAMLTNERFGLGLSLDELGVLKWQLCKIARYCDEFVDLADGSTERRWTFNAVIQTQEEAFHVLNSLASAFVATPLWASNEVLMMQDAPDDSEFPEDVNYSHIANQTNVIDGAFNYSGTAINAKHTVARVTWNDPDDFGRPTVACYENAEGIKRYGWRPKDVVAVGCTSYSQAIRYGRWVIETELSEGDLVTFIGDMSFGDCTPGNRIAVMDPCFADIRFGGRVTYAQTADGYTYITVDDAITLAAGTTYTLHLCIPLPKDEKPAERQEQVVQVISAEILTGASTTNYLKIAEQAVLPAIGSYWYVSEPNLNPRYFTCLANEPEPGQRHKITALYHDYSKYGRIYGAAEAAPLAPESYVPTGVIPAPADLDATEYAYESGNNWRPGVLLAWTHIDDARVVYYQIDRKRLDANEAESAWHNIGETEECSFNVQPCRAGDWAFRVRGMGALVGEWAEIESFTVVGKTVDPPPVENVQVRGGGTTFSTRALHLEWDTVIGEDYMPESRFLHYQVNVYDTDDNLKLIRRVQEEYVKINFSELNEHFSQALAQLKVSVVAVDIYRNKSENPTVITVTCALPPDVENLRVRGGGTTFSTRALHLAWRTVIGRGIPESRFLHYRIDIYDTDDNLKLTRTVTEEYVKITFSELNEHFGSVLAQLKVSVVAVDIYRNESENPTVITVTCAVPPDVDNLRVRGGDTTFSTRALHLEWDTVIGEDDMPEPRFLHYKVNVYDTDDNLKLTRTVTEEYVKITFSELNEHFGQTLTQLKVSVVAVDIYHNESETPTVITVTCALPPDVDNLRVRGGGTTFSTRALHLVWGTVIGRGIPGPRFLHYRIDIYDTDDNLKLTRTVTEEYVKITFSELNEHFGSALTQLKVSVVAVDIYHNESENPTVITVTCAVPPNISSLQVKGGGTTFADRDCHLEWTDVVDSAAMLAGKFKRYRINIYDTDNNLKWTRFSTKNEYSFTRGMNLKAFGGLRRTFKVGLVAVDIYGRISASETVITVSNPPPDMSAFTPTIKELTTGLRIVWKDWNDASDPDLKQFRIYCDTNNPPTTLVARVAADRDRYKHDDGIKSYASHYVKIVPYDEFGEGIGSIVAASTGQDVDIDKPIEIASSGKLIAGDVTGARVEYSSEALAGYSDETTKEFEISSTDGKIKAGGGSVTIGFDGVTLTQGVTKVNRIGWTSGASKVAGTDGYEYTCILSHIASSDNKPGEEGNNWPTYWQKEDRLGVGYWQSGDYYHATETDNISMLYGVDDPSNYRAYTTLHTRGDNIGASAETRVRARCASGKTAKILLYVNDDYISFSKTGSNPAALEIPAGIVVKSYSDIIAEANADAYITGGMSIGSVTNQNPAIGDVWVQSGIYLGSDYSAPGNGQVIAEGQIKTATKFVSTLETGKPIDVASTTVCTNLNADMVDGKHAGGANGLATLGAGGLVPTSQLGTGTADNTVFLRGDGTWQATAGASFNDAEGDPAKIGTTSDGISSYAARRDHVHACDDATTSTKGIAYFDSTNFMVSSGKVSLTTNGVPFIALPAFDTDKILGRSDSGSGPPSQITCTAAGRALLDDSTTADQRSTLGLKGAAVLDVGTTAGTVAAGDDSRFVTNGNNHDHNGGDGAQISHANLSNIGTNSHSTIDSFMASKAQVNGLASLNAAGTVVQNPANATAEAAPWKIAVADGSAKLDSWISVATTSTKGLASFSSTYFDVSSGAVSIKAAGVPYARIQNVSATDKILGRVSSGAGTIEEITCTAAGRALLDDASAAAQCTTLGLGTTDSPAFAGVTVSPSSRPVTISSGQVGMKGSAGGWTIGTRFLDSDSEAVGSFSAFGWDDDLVRYYIGTFESAELLSVTAAGLVGIGVTNPTYNLEIGCGDARHFGVQRQTASNTGGNNLNIYAGSATVAAENKNGGSLRLRPGLCTGSGYGQVQIYGCLGPGSGSSTTDGTYQELLTCRENKIGFFGGTPAIQQTLAAYTSDSESSAYTTTGSGSDIASKNDLNALRTAYETLRSMCDDLRAKLLATTLITS